MEENFLSWLAGFMDGDGCFSLPICLRKTKSGKEWININCQVRIGLKANDAWILEDIHEKIKAGSIYYSNKGKPNAVCYWQTTNWSDAIKVAELVLPYMRLKTHKAEQFLSAAKKYIEEMHPRGTANRHQGTLRSKEFMLEFAKISTSLNYDRQTFRYRNYKNFDYWKPIIERLYSKSN